MSKTFETKKKILNLLREGAKTPTDLSNALGLSPSTISQHLKELKYSGRIDEYQDEHFHNIKHYAMSQESMSMVSTTRAKYATAAFAIIFVVALLAFFLSQSGPNVQPALLAGQPNSVSVLLTDPPQVPNGTQALLVSYSSLKVQIANSSGAYWETINTSGTVNLLSLVNFTRNLTVFDLPANSVVDKISLNITNASIEINGTEYPVNVPESMLSLTVYTNTSSGTPFDILLDMSPTVSEVITGNQTEFVMIPLGIAATIPKSSNNYGTNAKEHVIAKISSQEAYALAQARPHINITDAYINSSNGQTSISLTVNDNSNKSAELFSVIIIGDDSYLLNLNLSKGTNYASYAKRPSDTFSPIGQLGSQVYGTAGISSSVNSAGAVVSSSVDPAGHVNAPSIITYPNAEGQDNASATIKSNSPVPSAYGWGNESLNDNIGGNFSRNGASSNYTFQIKLNRSVIRGSAADLSNSTVNDLISSIIGINGGLNASANLSANFNNSARIGKLVSDIDKDRYVTAKQELFRSVNFLVTQNGTIELQEAPVDFAQADIGYNLSSGGSVTLSYSGALTLASGRVTLQPNPGQEYRILVIGNDGAYAYTNVTAG